MSFAESYRRIQRLGLSTVVLAAVLGTVPTRADTLVTWDIPVSTTSAAPVYGSPLAGLTVSSIGTGGLSSSSSSTSWRWANLLNSGTVDPANMTTKAFTWTVTTSARTTASITQLLGAELTAAGTGPSTSLELWSQTVTSSGTGAWTRVGSSVATGTSAVSLNSAFFSSASPFTLGVNSSAQFRLVMLGATGGSTSPKIAWTSVSGSNAGADVSLIGTTGGGAWNLTWNGNAGTVTPGATGLFTGTDNVGGAQSNPSFESGDNITISTSGTMNVAAGGVSFGALTVSGTEGLARIAGGNVSASSITKTGAGTLALSGSNSFSGGGSLTGGTLIVESSNAIGAGAFTINGATLTASSGASTLGNAISIGAGGATVTNDSALTLSGAITGAGNVLTKSGSGALAITGALGASSAGVQVNVTGGSLDLSGAGAKEFGGTSVFNGNVNLQGATVYLSQNGEFTGTGVISTTGASTIQARTSSTGGTKTISNAVNINGTLALQSSSSRNLTLSGVLSGSGAVTTSGAAKVSLTSNTAGSFSGSLTVAHAAANGYTEVTTQALGNAAMVTMSDNSSRTGFDLNIANATSGTFGGKITGAGTLGIGGSAKATLSGVNDFSGGTLLSADVGITNASGLGTGLISSQGASARIYWDGSADSVQIGNAMFTGNTSSSVLAFAPGGTARTIALTGAVSGSGQLKISGGGTLDLSQVQANTNSGGIEIGSGRILAIAGVLGTGTVNFGTVSSSQFVAGAADMTVTNPFSMNGGYTAQFDTNGKALTIAAAITQKAAGGKLAKLGNGVLTLSSSNAYDGGTTLTQGTLRAAQVGAFGSGTVTVNGGVLDLGALAVTNSVILNGGSLTNAKNYAGSQTVAGITSYASGTVGGTITAVAGGTLKGSDVTFSGNVSIESGAIHAPGNSPGMQTFTGNLSYGAGSTMEWELIANAATGAGVLYDTIRVSGGSLSIADGALLSLAFNGAGSAVNWNDDFWDANHSWTVIGLDNGAASTGLFTLVGGASTWLDSQGVSLLDAMAANGRTTSMFSVERVGDTGDVVLTYAAVPEPSALALMGLGVMAIGLARVRSRRGN